MFSKKITAALFAAAGICAGTVAEEAVAVKPVWSGKNEITCGSRQLTCTPTGKITVLNGKKELFSFNMNSEILMPDKKIDWSSFDRAKSKMVKDDQGVMTWELMRTVGKETWKGMDQKLEITPDGLVKISYKLLPGAPKGMDWRNKSVWFSIDEKQYKGTNALYGGKEIALNEKLNVSDGWNGHDFVWEFGKKGTPEHFIIKAAKGKMRSMYSRKFSSPRYTVWFCLLNDGNGELLIDLR